MAIERRNLTALGRKRRREFDRSLVKLRDLGMPDWAVEYYRRASRIAGLPPHMVVCHVALVAASRQMQASLGDEPAAESETASEQPGGTPPHVVEPSYESMLTMRRQVTGLWREIQRHGTLLGIAQVAAGADPMAEGFAPGTVTPLWPDAPAPNSPRSRSPPR